MEKGQKSNISALKEYVYDLIQMTTQKTAGQREVKSHISWDELDMTIMSIVIEATALILSGDLVLDEDMTHQYAQLHFCNVEAVDRMIDLLQRMKELWEREEKQNG